MNYTAVLATVFKYLDTVWEENRKKCLIGSIGQAVVLLAPRAQLSESEQQSSLVLINQIKLKHPGNSFFEEIVLCIFLYI